MKIKINLKDGSTIFFVVMIILVIILALLIIFSPKNEEKKEGPSQQDQYDQAFNKGILIPKKFNKPEEVVSDFKHKAFPMYSGQAEIYYDESKDEFNVLLKGDTMPADIYAFFEEFPEVEDALALKINFINKPSIKLIDIEYKE